MRLRAVLVTPLSGSLADYGRAGAVALRLWAEAAGADLRTYDAEPDPTSATRAALATTPDLVFGPYGSGPARAVLGAAAGRLVFNHGGSAHDDLGTSVNVLAPADTSWQGAVRLAAYVGLRSVHVAHGDSGFGRTVGGGAYAEAVRLGLAATRGRLSANDAPPAELLLTAGRFAQEQAAAAALLPGPWRLAGFCGAGVDEVLAFLGAAREGLLGPAQWTAATAPTATLGPAADEFVRAYRAAAGVDPPYPAAQAFAAGLIAERCLADAGGTDDAAVRAAAAELDEVTLFGRFRLDATGRQVGHRILTVQWQDGVRRVVWPPDQAEVAIRIERLTAG